MGYQLPQDDEVEAPTSFQQVADSSYGTSKKYIQKEEESFYNPFQSLGNSQKSIAIEEEKASIPSQIHHEQQFEGSSLVDAPAAYGETNHNVAYKLQIHN